MVLRPNRSRSCWFCRAGVKKVIVALCMLEIATGFTPGGPKCLKHGEIRKRGKGKSPWEKGEIGRERPHFFCGKPPKSPLGSLPPSGAKACAVPFSHCDKDFG